MSNENTQQASASKKIDEALALLNEAARLKKDEFQQIFSDKYSHLKDALNDVVTEKASELKQAGRLAQDKIEDYQEFVDDAVKDLDKEVRKNPWPYLAGAATVSLLIGFILGGSSRR